MIEIRIPKSVSPKTIDSLCEKYISQSDLSNIRLVIPGSISKYTFGLLSDLLRFVITLNNKARINSLKIDVEGDNIDSIYGQEYVYPIISLLWNSSNFIDKNNLDIKPLLRDKQNDFFNTMNSLSRMKGNKYILTNTDHLSKNRGLVRLLENSEGFNDDEDQISSSIGRVLINNVLKFNKKNKVEFESIIDDVGAIVYELAKNTYEWGKTDSHLIDISPSIRGVYFRFHINDSDKIIEEFNETPIETFFQHPFILDNCINKQNKIYYLEILVFDSGIGFIDKFQQKNDLDDLEIIKKCLVKNQTSSNTTLKTKKGIGLDRILNILDKKGFFRISTDKYCVYRDLIKDNYEPIDINHLGELRLENWNMNVEIKEQHKAQGSYISILYPFKKSN